MARDGRRLGRLVTAAAVALLAGGFTVAVVRADGYKADHVTLHDNGVWLTKQGTRIGRFNADLQKVDTQSGSFANITDLQQIDGTVVVTTTTKMFSYDVALNRQRGEVDLPPTAHVSIGGSNGALLDAQTHKLWFTDRDTVGAVKTDETQGAVTLDGATLVQVGTDGTAHVVAPAQGRVWALREILGIGGDPEGEPGGPQALTGPSTSAGPTTTSAAGAPTTTLVPPPAQLTASLADPGLQLTTAGPHAVFLDPTAKVMIVDDGRAFALPVEIGASPRLQLPSADADRVLVASDAGLALVRLADGTAEVLYGTAGTAALEPVWLNGCAYGAWAERAARACGPAVVEADMPASESPLRFRTNRGQVALNFVSGNLLSFGENGITYNRDWSDALDNEQKKQSEAQEGKAEEQPNKCTVDPTKPNTPPVAVADTFTVRAGQSTLLDVLNPSDDETRRDSDVDCDVLTVSIAKGLPADGSLGRLDSVRQGRALQYTPPAKTASGPIGFDYTVSDGHRDGTAQAHVDVQVIAADAPGSSPVAVADRTTVQVGRTVVFDVLANDWDAEGDSLSVTGALARNVGDGTLVWQPNGRLAYTAPGSGSGTKSIDYTIADDHGGTASGVLEVNVIGQDVNGPPNPLSDALTGMLAPAGGEPTRLSVNVLANDSDPNNDALRLASVQPYGDTPTDPAPSFLNGVVSFQPTAPGAYTYVYTVDDGHGATATARLRFDVLPDLGELAPVAVKDTGVVNTARPSVIDVMANDSDLNGDVIMISDVTLADDARDVLNVETIDHRILRVTAKQSAPSRPFAHFTYTISDGTLTAEGTVVVSLVTTSGGQAPITLNDSGQVHQGGYIALPVLANDFDPDGDPLSITAVAIDDKVAVGGDPGLVFAQGDQLRYLAPRAAVRAEPFTVTGTYTVTDGRDATNGRFSISVTQATAENDSPPDPPTLELRTYAGQVATLPLPSYGVDPDGDPVEIVTRTVEPTRGTVAVDPDGTTFRYTPFPTNSKGQPETGKDAFQYQLRDSFGKIGYLNVRVVIAARPPNRPPVAVNDVAQVLPGKTATIPVLANDTDPDPDDVVSLDRDRPFDQPADGSGQVAAADDGFLSYAAPLTLGQYSFNYFVTDGHSAPVAARVSVTVTDTVVNRPPVVKDQLLGPQKVGTVVTIDPLKDARDPEGGPLGVAPGDDALKLGVTTDNTDPARPKLTVTMADEPMVFTFQVFDEQGAVAYGVVQIPLPENRPPVAAPLEVTIEPGETTKVIDVGPQLSDPDGDPVVVRDQTRPTANPAEAAAGDMAWSGTRFTFTRNPEFGGSATVTYSITDQPAAGDPIVVPGTVVLTIKRNENKPPVVSPGRVELEAGTSQTFDLRSVVQDPDPGDDALLTFSGVGASGLDGVTVDASAGSSVTFTAPEELLKVGESRNGAVAFTVSDGKENGTVKGTVTVVVVPSNKPGPQAVPDVMDPVKQGATGTKNVVQNDTVDATEAPIRIVRVTQSPGGTVAVSGTDSVTFTPTAGFSGETSFTYTIRDKRDDAARESTATVTVSVQDKPAAPGQPTVGEQLSRTAVVSFNRPDDHGSPIDAFEVSGTPGGTATCTASPCTVNGLTNGVEYRFKVRAHNGVDWSDWSPDSPPYTPDELPGTPPAPTADWGDSTATVDWGAIANAGSEILDVTVSVSPADAQPKVHPGGQTGGQETFTGLKNGTSYTFTVTARNKKGSSPTGPASNAVTPAGAPRFTSRPDLVPDNGFVVVSWAAADGNGDNALTYRVNLRDVTAGTDDAVDVGATLSRQLPAVNGHVYQATITAFNKYTARFQPAGVTGPASVQVTPKGPPKAPGTPTATAGAGNGNVRLTFGAADANGGTITGYEVSIDGGGFFGVGNTTSPTISGNGMVLGGSYTFRVRAVNEVGPGAVSGASGAAVPYTPPAAPSGSGGSGGGYVLRWNWSYGALNGPGPQTVTVSLDGAVVASGGTSYSFDANAPNSAHSLTVRVCNAGGAGNNCSQATWNATTPDLRKVWTTRDQPYPQATGSCAANECYSFTVHVSGFAPNQTFPITCFPENAAFRQPGGNVTTNASGAGTHAENFQCVAANGANGIVSVQGVIGDGVGFW